ncbi:TonB-dependent receptor [Sanyastnella coralliicola]|uniref:TonB-dependent receptor n=1 Tax=Sanyastnella coralliicola TaxID=3069118 RepID=UPI0027B9A0C3|nr:TonB-dependent receptor [Longitalea sp. SCSIO 12813]
MRRVLLGLLVLLFSSAALAQKGTIKGRLVDGNSNESLPFATVYVMGTELGATTDLDGYYQIQVDPGEYTLEFKLVGYQPMQKKATVKAGQVVSVDATMASQQDITDYPLVLPVMEEKIINLSTASIAVTGSAPENGVFASSDVSAAQLDKLNNGQDLPILLRFTPSIVTTSDAGAGIGYTGLRIRGSDQSRINVTINGIPYNDPESQGVFWVNLPDFSSSIDNVSIQRGVGSSTNGAGAFGGSIGLRTDRMAPQAFAEITNSVGSFNTFRHTVEFGSGLMPNGFAIEGRLSQITSDGYIDRASSDLKSYFLNGQYNKGRVSIKGLVFGGREETYQAWWGVPEVALDGSEAEIREWGANNFYSEQQIDDMVNLGRQSNYYTYENEVDNYAQDHYQLHFAYDFGSGLVFRAAGHYTYGRGYFEQFRASDDLSIYNIDNIILNAVQQFADAEDLDGNPTNTTFNNNYDWDEVEISHTVVTDQNGDPITDGSGNPLLNSIAQISTSDVIRRRWLENDFYGATWSLDFTRRFDNDQLNAVLGGAWNAYDGDHFGEIIWMEHPNNSEYQDFYYLNNGFKTDFNSYLKVNYLLNRRMNVYADLQVRQVTYEASGIDADLIAIDVTDTLNFFNPKVGFSFDVNRNNMVYASYAIGNREPTRNDYIDALDGEAPRPEQMGDLEFGYRRMMPRYNFLLNFYNMNYTDQLVLTGDLNDVGTPVRTNVAESYRRGVEAEFGYRPFRRLLLVANATYSQNKIQDFTELIFDYDVNAFQETELGETDISFSPDLIASAQVIYTFLQRGRLSAEAAWQTKYVSEQYLDNTSNSERVIPSYLVNDFRMAFYVRDWGMRQLSVNLMVNNVLDETYVNNGYTYGFIDGGSRIHEEFFYPQAGRNYLVGLTLRF